MTLSEKRTSIQLAYIFIYVASTILLINSIEKTSEYYELFKFMIIFFFNLLYFFTYENFTSLIFKKLGLGENDKEDKRTAIKYSKKVVNSIIFLISIIFTYVVFSIFKNLLIISIIASFITFVLSQLLLEELVNKSFER